MQSISPHDLAPQLANCRSYWLGWNVGRVLDDHSFTTYRSGLDNLVMNGILRWRGQDVAEAAGRARRYFAGLPWLWWISEDSGPGLATALRGLGAAEVDREPVMAIDLEELPDLPAPQGLRVQQVRGPQQMAAFVSAYLEPMGLAAELGPQAAVIEAARQDHLVRFAGLLDGRVVGTSVLSVSDGVAGIYVVSTDAAYRRRGIATAMTLAALRAGRNLGLRVGTLQATAEGEPVYRRLGFETVGEYRLYQLPDQ